MIRHPVAWGAWTIAALAAAFIDRNPYVQALLLLAVINVYLPYRGRRQATWKFGLALAIVPILFSAALSRFGRHVLFTLPPIPIIGGRWTLDAVAFGASTGLALLLTVAVFAVLQSTVRSADVLAILPRPLYRAGTTVALALAFAPKTLVAFQSIREARQLRGQRTGWRAAPALLLPLLLTTLERALQYGESLDARGFGSGRRGPDCLGGFCACVVTLKLVMPTDCTQKKIKPNRQAKLNNTTSSLYLVPFEESQISSPLPWDMNLKLFLGPRASRPPRTLGVDLAAGETPAVPGKSLRCDASARHQRCKSKYGFEARIMACPWTSNVLFFAGGFS